jgi:hypothetical protein
LFLEPKRLENANITIDYIEQHLLKGKLLLDFCIDQVDDVLSQTQSVDADVLLISQVDYTDVVVLDLEGLHSKNDIRCLQHSLHDQVPAFFV